MLKAKKWMTPALIASSGIAFNGCLGAFWDGLWNTGWPREPRWLNIASDIIKVIILPGT